MRAHLITFNRIIRAGLLNFVRNLWLAIAAMAMMLVTLTIILFLVIANATFANTIKQITDKIDVSVYLKDEVTIEQRDKLVSDIRALPNVKSTEYVSKEEALKNYQRQNAGNAELLSAISQTDNPLPATIQIKPNDTDRIEEIRTFLEKPEVKDLQSDETSYSGDRKAAIDKISNSTRILREVAAIGVIIFTMISVLIIFNTIQMAIFNRRDELTIMRLLGASTNFIRGPFVVESVIYGVMSAVVSVILCGSLFTVASTTFEATSLGLLDIGFASDYFAEHFWVILGFQLVIGILIGTASSTIATRRYLKFKTTK